jgi:hypothetical protein
MSGQHKVAWLCEALLVSRSGYYDWKKRRGHPGPRQLESQRLRERIREEFMRSRQTYGSPRLARVLGYPGRRNRIARLMRLEHLFARQRSKYRVATTDSRHGGPIAPNRVQSLTVYEDSSYDSLIRFGPPTPPAYSQARVGYIWLLSWISLPGA